MSQVYLQIYMNNNHFFYVLLSIFYITYIDKNNIYNV